MSARARWCIVEDDFIGAEPLVIRDVGPWDKHPTVTNDAEAVVEDLVRQGQLPPGRRLFYVDSDGQRDEIIVKHGQFAGFGSNAS